MIKIIYRIPFAAALLAMSLVLNAAPLAAEEIRLARGRIKTIVLPENPSTGYTWKIDEEGSDHLSLLTIVDHGHKRGASMPGAPGERSWTLRARGTGRAVLQLVYQRPWEPAPVETRRIDVVIP
jgi:inhibitor of cysteine peptidase